jgi:hypothetical protein
MEEEGRYSIDFPLLKSRRAQISPGLVEALGAYPDEVHAGTNVLCIFGEEEIVGELRPDYRMLAGIHGAQGVIVSAKTSRIGYHFVSRYFAPKLGLMKIMRPVVPIANWLGIGAKSLVKTKWWVFRFLRAEPRSDVRFVRIEWI